MTGILVHNHLLCGVLPPQKRSEVWSLSGTPTSRNIPSMSAENPYRCWRNFKMMYSRFCSRSGPAINAEFRDCLWNNAAPLRTLRTFPGLFGLSTGWWGKYHSRFERFCDSLGSTVFTYPLSKSSLIVWAYLSRRSASLPRRFLRDFSWARAA